MKKECFLEYCFASGFYLDSLESTVALKPHLIFRNSGVCGADENVNLHKKML